MPTLVLETKIAVSRDTCFDLMRDIRVHTETATETNETAIAGVTDGLIGLGQTVTFEGTHFGLRQRLTVKVVEFDRPRLFVDEMIQGALKSFRHTHEFVEEGDGTLMRDTLTWTSPLGPLGLIADKLFLEKHLKSLVATRNARLKQIAESVSL